HWPSGIPFSKENTPPTMLKRPRSRSMRGHRSEYFFGRRLVQRSGGSTTWSSTEMIFGRSDIATSSGGWRGVRRTHHRATPGSDGRPPAGTVHGPSGGDEMTTQQPTDVPAIKNWSRLLDGKVAVVTGGGADGIGGAIARLFAEHGALVEIAEIDEQRAERNRAAIAGAGGAVRAHVVDVVKQDDVERLADAVLTEHGRVDVLVNNVGDYRPLVRFDQSTPESWQAMYEVNLLHFFVVTRAFLPSMMERRTGSIVNVHSV